MSNKRDLGYDFYVGKLKDDKEKQKKEFETYSIKLPSYFHNMTQRNCLDATLERSLRETQATTTNFAKIESSFYKKSFRLNDKKPKDESQANKPTFNQLLQKYGYI